MENSRETSSNAPASQSQTTLRIRHPAHEDSDIYHPDLLEALKIAEGKMENAAMSDHADSERGA
jgi:hypothetical protein